MCCIYTLIYIFFALCFLCLYEANKDDYYDYYYERPLNNKKITFYTCLHLVRVGANKLYIVLHFMLSRDGDLPQCVISQNDASHQETLWIRKSK